MLWQWFSEDRLFFLCCLSAATREQYCFELQHWSHHLDQKSRAQNRSIYWLLEILNRPGSQNDTKCTKVRPCVKESWEPSMTSAVHRHHYGFILATPAQVNFQTLRFYCPWLWPVELTSIICGLGAARRSFVLNTGEGVSGWYELLFLIICYSPQTRVMITALICTGYGHVSAYFHPVTLQCISLWPKPTLLQHISALVSVQHIFLCTGRGWDTKSQVY